MKTSFANFILLSLSSWAPSGKAEQIAIPFPAERYLIITADDFGASANINEGIRLAANNDIITTISALTNFRESLGSLKSISVEHPHIGIGVHLNITTGKPLSNPRLVASLVDTNGNFHTINELLPQLRNVSLDEVRIELKAQIQILLDYGIALDHLSDQHGILSLYPPFYEIVVELAREYKAPIRSPIIASKKYPGIFPHSEMDKKALRILKTFILSAPLKAISCSRDFRLLDFDRKINELDSERVPHPDLLIDYFYGNPTLSNLIYILEHLPPGIKEIILHLGTSTRQEEYPSGLDVDYFPNRELELMTVSDGCLNDYLYHFNIRKICYAEINKLKATQCVEQMSL